MILGEISRNMLTNAASRQEINTFQPSVEIHLETANYMTGFLQHWAEIG